MEVDADLPGQRLQLQYRRRTVDVGADDEHLLLLFAQEPRELRRGRRLARALKTGKQYHGRGLRCEIERRGGRAHHRRQFALHDADQRLARRQRPDDLLALRRCLDAGDELLDDGQRDVGLEQGEPYFAQRVLDVGVGEPCLAAQALHDTREPFCQVIEHRGMDAVGRGARAEGGTTR